MMVPIRLQLLTFHVDKTWSGPLMGRTQHTSKMVRVWTQGPGGNRRVSVCTWSSSIVQEEIDVELLLLRQFNGLFSRTTWI